MILNLRVLVPGLCFLASVGACGGKVVYDGSDPGTTGSSGTSSTNSTGTGTTTGSCAELAMDLAAKILIARECSPLVNVVQCDGSAAARDICGCTVLLNETNTQAVSAALNASAAAAQAGCMVACDTPCEPSGGGFCAGTDPGSGNGLCQTAFPD